jgi:hypothetical protein
MVECSSFPRFFSLTRSACVAFVCFPWRIVQRLNSVIVQLPWHSWSFNFIIARDWCTGQYLLAIWLVTVTDFWIELSEQETKGRRVECQGQTCKWHSSPAPQQLILILAKIGSAEDIPYGLSVIDPEDLICSDYEYRQYCVRNCMKNPDFKEVGLLLFLEGAFCYGILLPLSMREPFR